MASECFPVGLEPILQPGVTMPARKIAYRVLQQKNISLSLQNTLAYSNRCVLAVNAENVELAPGVD
jgi:hypothetical protein